MQALKELLGIGDQRESPEAVERSALLDRLFVEHEAGKIRMETAEEIRYQTLRAWQVSGDGYKAVEAALKLAFSTPAQNS